MNPYIFPFLWMRGETEEILRREIAKIYECGIRAVCVEARPHEDFCGPLWWRDMDIVIDEAKKRGMKIWILDDKHFPTGYAAGLIETTYPERKKWYLADTTADIFGGVHERTLHVSRMLKPVIGFWQIGQLADEEERAKNQLVALVALRFSAEDRFYEEAVDLTDNVRDGYASFCLPEGQWRVHAIYKTRTDGGNEHYINMLDAVSAHTQIEGVYEAHFRRYPEEFGKTIAGFFSDEPELGNTKEIAYDHKLGKPGMQLPWSEELETRLQNRWGNAYRTSLPFLFAMSEEQRQCPQIRYDYMDQVTELYEKYFSNAIGSWCREHGVEYIGHVVEDNGTHSRTGHGPGHWFRAMSGQDMAGIDVIGGQVVYGAPVQIRKGMGGMETDGEFFHSILGKLGASAGHLDPRKKGRTMCELFGAYGWDFGVRDMRYLLDHLLCRGVNHLVPHAFSMAEYPDPDCPPHFYAGGHNGQFPWFAELMKYAGRMCAQLNGGQHVASVAVLYDGEADWTGEHMPMQKVGRVLMEHQIEFDVVSCDMLRDLSGYQGSFDGNTLIINGVSFDALIIPYAQYLPAAVKEFTESCDRFPVIFAGGYPDAFLADGTETDAADAWKNQCLQTDLSGLYGYLQTAGLTKIRVTPAFEMLSVYHYRKEGQMFLLMNESADRAFRGTLTLPAEEPLYVYDGDRDRYFRLAAGLQEEEGNPVPSDKTNGRSANTTIRLSLEPGQSILIVEASQVPAEELAAAEETVWKSFAEQLSGNRQVLDLSGGWQVQLCLPAEYPAAGKEFHMEKLIPVSDSEPAFSGIIRYTRTFRLDQVPEKAVFWAEQVFEVMKVLVNGQEAGIRMTPPYQADLTGRLCRGENTITVEVANTPGRDQMHYPAPPFDFQHDALEPSGMFGDAKLYIRTEADI